MSWKYGGLADWTNGKTAFISVVFSWNIQDAYQKAIWYKAQGYKVAVGGPALAISWQMFNDVADILGIENGVSDAIAIHNPQATFTSRGCIRNCPFCIVPKSEGGLVELNDFPIRPIVCDNNFLATSQKHFDRVIDKLKPLKQVDFNQGLDARLLTKYHANRLAELDLKLVRLAWDYIGMEAQWMKSFEILRSAGFTARKIQSYVLFNFNDTPADTLYRLEKIKSLGARPNPMRYQPLDTLKRNSYIHPNWTDGELKRFQRYWSRLRWFEHIPFEEFNNVRTY